MKDLLRDTRVLRLLIANTAGSIGSGITIFSVPWLLVQQTDGASAYRWATIGTTLVLFAIMPYYGAWVDRHSRKTMLLVSEAWGFFATATMAVIGLVLGDFSTWQLVAIFFCGMLYYTLHYPAKFALVQQMFDRSQYQSLIGLMEIQGQTAMMIAGGLGGWLVAHVPLWTILLIDALSYLVSFSLQATLPYRATHLENRPAIPPRVWSSVAEGWRWLRERPQLTLFLTCSLMPFIAVMVGNYLFPIYVSQTLRAGPEIFAAGEITFALGAIAAGAILPRLLAQHSAATTVPGTMIAFLIGIAAIVTLQHPIIYLAAGALLGFGNAGCRVARSALMLHVVPNEVMGRVSIFYNALDRVLRTMLVSAMVIIELHGPPAGFVLLFALLLFALFGVLQSRAGLPTAAPAPA